MIDVDSIEVFFSSWSISGHTKALALIFPILGGKALVPVMQAITVILFVLMWRHASSYTTRNCVEEKNVLYAIHEYHIPVYSCSEKKSCDIVGFSHIDAKDIQRNVKEKCVCSIKKKCNDNNISKQKFCVSSAKVDLVKNVIYLPQSNPQALNRSGTYYNENLDVHMVWLPELKCNGSETIYHGPVDMLKFQGEHTRRLLLGKTSPQFTLELVERRKICGRRMWKTNRDGVLALESKENSTTVITNESKLKNLPEFKMNIEIICELIPRVNSQTEKVADLRSILMWVVVVIGVYLFWVIVTSLITCVTNYHSLKRKGVKGSHLLRCCSSVLTSHYIWVRKSGEPMVDEVCGEEYAEIENSTYYGKH